MCSVYVQSVFLNSPWEVWKMISPFFSHLATPKLTKTIYSLPILFTGPAVGFPGPPFTNASNLPTYLYLLWALKDGKTMRGFFVAWPRRAKRSESKFIWLRGKTDSLAYVPGWKFFLSPAGPHRPFQRTEIFPGHSSVKERGPWEGPPGAFVSDAPSCCRPWLFVFWDGACKVTGRMVWRH